MVITSGEDGRSRAEQLLHILRQLDIYVSSPLEHQRWRGCTAVHELLLKFRALCSGGIRELGRHSSFSHNVRVNQAVPKSLTNLPCKSLL